MALHELLHVYINVFILEKKREKKKRIIYCLRRDFKI